MKLYRLVAGVDVWLMIADGKLTQSVRISDRCYFDHEELKAIGQALIDEGDKDHDSLSPGTEPEDPPAEQ